MPQNTDLVDVLNELVRINYDRVRGYEKAIAEVEKTDADLVGVFKNFADQSHEFVSFWQHAIRSIAGDPVTDSTASGKLYRIWMDFKAAITGHHRGAILESCEFGEKAAIDAYEDALSTTAPLTDDFRQAIANQKRKIAAAYQTIKSLRAAQKGAS